MSSLKGKLQKWYRTQDEGIDPPAHVTQSRPSVPSKLPTKDFQYKPPELIKHRTFRVLHLRPAKHCDDMLQFNLSISSLTSPPEYDVISYTWDGQPFDIGAVCHGKRFFITKNCQTILKTLRRRKKDRMIWIDQICVNQSDLDDRSFNVRNMGAIYKKSRNVFIWPGNVDAETKDFLCRIVGNHCRTVDEYDNDPKYYENPALEEIALAIESEEVARIGDRMYNQFISSPWFGRMWTFQEYVGVEHDNIFFVLGDDLLWTPRLERFASTRSTSTVAGLTSLARLRMTSEHLELSSILEHTLQRQCSEPKDKIFALHGVIGALLKQGHISQLLPFPTPNYFEKTYDTYSKATKWALDHRRDVGMIYLAAISTRELSLKKELGGDGMPSWIPNLHFLSQLHRPSVLGLSSIASHLTYSASAGSSLHLSYGGFWNTLHLMGTIFGVIDFVGSECAGMPNPVSDEYAGYSHARTFYATLKSWLEEAQSYAQTHSDDPDFNFEMELRSLFRGSLSHLQSRFLYDTNEECQALLDRIEVGCTGNPETLLNKSSDDRDSSYVGCCAHLTNKTLLISKRGPIGIGLGHFLANDKIVLAAGFGELLILRPARSNNSSFFTFVGYAYMEGLMQGESWPDDVSELVDIYIE